jgi:hypothetical protein
LSLLNASAVALAYGQLSSPRYSCWRDCAFALPSEPAAKAHGAMPRLGLHGARLSSELPNDVRKRAGAVDLCDRRWQRFAVFSPTPSLLLAVAAERLHDELSIAR